jgi:hypothetical protein
VRISPDAEDARLHLGDTLSLVGQVGGRLSVALERVTVASIGIGGPREGRAAAFERLRARLRVRLVRNTVGGAPPLGASDDDARSLVQGELLRAARLWGQCGIDFGPSSALELALVDPPQVASLSVGCDLGLPASGGDIVLMAGGVVIRDKTRSAESPQEVSSRLTLLLEGAGLSVQRFDNPRSHAGAGSSVDLVVGTKGNSGPSLSRVGDAPLCTDQTLGLCLRTVDLLDGLSHFVDSNSGVGTEEERALLDAVIDRDQASIDIVVVPSFTSERRLGESFIVADETRFANTIILSESAFTLGRRSQTLAHELGHVFLQQPGHPDDFGSDRSWSLMDSDALDASPIGPRRLTLEECDRAIQKSGPSSHIPLLVK